jgi:hypothetical protein
MGIEVCRKYGITSFSAKIYALPIAHITYHCHWIAKIFPCPQLKLASHSRHHPWHPHFEDIGKGKSLRDMSREKKR